MRRSIDHFVEIMSDEARIPFLKLDIFYADNALELYPTDKEIFGTMAKVRDKAHLQKMSYFCFSLRSVFQVVDSIATIAQELPSLETWVDVSSREELIPMKICQPYLEEMQARLLRNLTHLYKPVKDHLETLAGQYKMLFSDDLKKVDTKSRAAIFFL